MTARAKADRLDTRHVTHRGSATTELVLLTPLLVAVLGVMFFAGRLVLARQAVDDAARTALQAAVIMSDGQQAQILAGQTARVSLGTGDDLCARVSTVTNTANFLAGGNVSVTVTCLVRFSSLTFAGVPGSVTLSSTQTGDIEPYREVGP
jgi:hypothetical protein